nr:hypothetical protein [uncultured Butyrivibrio sp.]
MFTILTAFQKTIAQSLENGPSVTASNIISAQYQINKEVADKAADEILQEIQAEKFHVDGNFEDFILEADTFEQGGDEFFFVRYFNNSTGKCAAALVNSKDTQPDDDQVISMLVLYLAIAVKTGNKDLQRLIGDASAADMFMTIIESMNAA